MEVEEKDFAYSLGFLEEWLKGHPKQVSEHLKTVADAISFYRNRYQAVKDKFDELIQENNQLKKQYNETVASAAKLLDFARSQAERISETEQLIEEQRPFYRVHKEGLDKPQ
ncbi:MAG TPA: hypothetical protein VFA52_04490 [Candidatus Paceibacterota bacterium]|jgi:chromosome segregation ATPase|nr:hypothetical protein [Candidatus Paceibacterota bacterium]